MQNLAKKLQTLIEKGTAKHPLPLVKGNSIRIGKVVIRYSANKGYLLFDVQEKEQIGLLHSKVGALAAAKQYNQNNDIDVIQFLDKKYQKHDNDCMFHSYFLRNTKDSLRKDIVEMRLEISQAHKNETSKQLESYIFDK